MALDQVQKHYERQLQSLVFLCLQFVLNVSRNIEKNWKKLEEILNNSKNLLQLGYFIRATFASESTEAS